VFSIRRTEIHIGARRGLFHLWATEGAASAARSFRAAGTYFPGALSYDELKSIIKSIVGGSHSIGYPVKAYIWLPEELTARSRTAGSRGRLLPYAIPTIGLDEETAVAILHACLSRQAFAGNIFPAADLLYWTYALRLAIILIVKQQYLPGLVSTDFVGWRAVWEPVYSDETAEFCNRLAQSMPGAARAITMDDHEPPGQSASDCMWAVVRTLVDYLVRAAQDQSLSRLRQLSADSLHDDWIAALMNIYGYLDDKYKDAPKWQQQLQAWQRPIKLVAGAPFRLCLRLEEPVPPTEDWHLRFLAQSRHDPSLLIPAADIFSNRKISPYLPKSEIREALLMSLALAANISKAVEKGLQQKVPDGSTLDGDAAFHFLTEEAPRLEEAGFSIMLPAWWVKGTDSQLKVKAEVKSPPMKTKGRLSLDALVSIDWHLLLDGEEVAVEEIKALAKLKTPLVQMRGRWVMLKPEDMEAIAAYWRQKEKKITARQFINMALTGQSPISGLALADYKADGWLGQTLTRLENKSSISDCPLPKGLNGVLRPYQKRGYDWLQFLCRAGLGACLADDMGLGKTIQTLASILKDKEDGEQKPVLIVCPTSVLNNWLLEARKFTPELKVMVHHGSGRLKEDQFSEEAGAHDLVLTTYSLLHRDVKSMARLRWAGVVLDEAQNIKNPETKQARAARTLAAAADYRIALTGTPVENHVGDLWSIMEFLNPGMLGTAADYRRRFFLPIHHYNQEEAAAELKKLTGPFILRRVKTDKAIIADLPEKIESKAYCGLTKEQASLYQAVANDLLEQADAAEGMARRGLILSALTRLKQVCNHPALFLGDHSALTDRSGKLNRLTELLEETLSAGDRSLIFTQFAQMGELLQDYLQERFGQEVLFLHGGVPRKERDEMVTCFQQTANGTSGPRAPQIFILSLKAGGTGLNLTAANHVFHFDRWWNPAVENQATDRAFRIGQKKGVQVHKFICRGTLEERIDEIIEQKRGMAEMVVGSGEQWLTELTTSQLRELIMLAGDVTAE